MISQIKPFLEGYVKATLLYSFLKTMEKSCMVSETPGPTSRNYSELFRERNKYSKERSHNTQSENKKYRTKESNRSLSQTRDK